MWLFRHKYLAYGTLSRYKDCIIANGSKQLEVIDVNETFSPVVKPDTIRTVLSLATSRHCLKGFGILHIPTGCNSSRAPVDTESKLGDDGDPVCLFMHDPREPHFSALKQILRYVRGTLDHSTEAEYRGVINVVAETCWLRNLLREFQTLLSSATLIYCDNVSNVYLSSNPVQH
ncbi:ribonuclease H-like domain-containing protein [Tanacetum coccineum]